MKTDTLTPERLDRTDSYWRAANYLSVCQIYVDGEACELVSGTTRLFRLNDAGTNGAADRLIGLST